jgi:hypothetical protein
MMARDVAEQFDRWSSHALAKVKLLGEENSRIFPYKKKRSICKLQDSPLVLTAK